MAVTWQLVNVGHNFLRYLLAYSGSGPQTVPPITSTGAASPDLLTDSVNGPIRELAEAFTDGIGILPAGAKTQAQARAIWLADNSDVVLGNEKIARALVDVTGRVGTDLAWSVDANVDGGGHPVIQLASVGSTAAAWSVYVDIEIQGSIGR
jgi:hypothetical protein